MRNDQLNLPETIEQPRTKMAAVIAIDLMIWLDYMFLS